MSTGATTNWQIPLFGDTDFVTPIQTPLNAQANALDAALTKGAFTPYPTLAALQLVTTGNQVGQHATVNADTTNNGDYTWNGTAWVTYSATGTFTPTGIYSAGNPAPTVTKQAGRVWLDGIVISTSASFVAGTVYTVGSITAALAPAANQVFAAISNVTALAQVTVTSTGSITVVLNTSFTGALNLTLANCSWKK